MRTRNQEKKEEAEGHAVELSEEAQPGRTKTPKKRRKSLSEASAEADDAAEVVPLSPGAKKKKTAKEQITAGGREAGASPGDDAALAARGDGAGEGSEDEAPEEMSLAGGKLAAERQAQEEKKERAEGRKTSKKKRRRTVASDEGRGGGEAPHADAEEALDELPPEIIAALQKQATEEEALRVEQASSGGRMTFDAGAELLESEKVPYHQDGPVMVRILGDTARPSFNPSESAREYAKQRLYGARLKRSTAMLQPVGGSRIQI